MQQLKVAILGQGRSGRDIHGAHLITDSERFKIVAIVDPMENRRERAFKEYGCDVYADHHDLYDRKDIDLVINATPSHMHVPITKEFLNHGFNVLCDKPLARKAEEVDMLISTAGRQGKLLAVFQQSRFAPCFQQVKKVMDSGVLGRIVQISLAYNGFARRWDWQTLQDFNGGNLLNTGPHPVDQALRLLDVAGMPEVICIMDRANTFGDAEDYVKLLLRAGGRPVIDLEISSCCAYPSFTYNVQGTCGGLVGSTEHVEWKYFKPREAPKQILISEPLSNAEGMPAFCSEQLKWYQESWDMDKTNGDLYPVMAAEYYKMLYNAMVDGAPMEVTVEQVRQQIAVMEECHRQNPLSRLSKV